MGYFPNGSAGLAFQEQWCLRCRNYRDKGDDRGPGCAIWDAHLLYSYDAAGEDPESKGKRAVLDVLIPQKDAVDLGECAVFLDDERDHDTLTLPGITG